MLHVAGVIYKLCFLLRLRIKGNVCGFYYNDLPLNELLHLPMKKCELILKSKVFWFIVFIIYSSRVFFTSVLTLINYSNNKYLINPAFAGMDVEQT